MNKLVAAMLLALALVIAAFYMAPRHQVEYTFINGGFEMGNLTGWLVFQQKNLTPDNPRYSCIQVGAAYRRSGRFGLRVWGKVANKRRWRAGHYSIIWLWQSWPPVNVSSVEQTRNLEFYWKITAWRVEKGGEKTLVCLEVNMTSARRGWNPIYKLYYVLACGRPEALKNTSNKVYILLPETNKLGTWLHFSRNIVADVKRAYPKAYRHLIITKISYSQYIVATQEAFVEAEILLDDFKAPAFKPAAKGSLLHTAASQHKLADAARQRTAALACSAGKLQRGGLT